MKLSEQQPPHYATPRRRRRRCTFNVHRIHLVENHNFWLKLRHSLGHFD
jgi:hypothetical protein